jgi:hypothetical protein
MMKKFLVLMLVLGMTSSAWATVASFVVAPEDVKDHYAPSDSISIGVVADFYVGLFGINYVYGEPTASSPYLHQLLNSGIVAPGDVINDGGVLVQAMMGQIAGANIEDGILPGQVVWGFEYHVPQVPPSTWLTITASGVDIADAWYDQAVSSIVPLEIHVIPEPATIALMGLGGLLLRRRKK